LTNYVKNIMIKIEILVTGLQTCNLNLM